MIRVPEALACAASADGREGWLGTIELTVRAVETRWGIRVEDPFEPGGQTAWVAPVAGRAAVVKLGWRHPEAEHEADGLRIWQGRASVRLLDVAEFPDTTALLLERCDPGDPLSRLPQPEQDVVIAEILRELWPADPSGADLPTLDAMCRAWADRFERKPPPKLDPAIVRDGIALFRSLPATASSTALLCTDLHAGNVLAARRRPWLAIDPKPHIGDPTYDALQHMLNCPDRLAADPVAFVERMAGLLDLDAERLRQWLFARCVQEAPTWPSLAPVAAALGRRI